MQLIVYLLTSNIDLLDIVHLCCLLFAMIPGFVFAKMLDYPKLFKARNNQQFYFASIVIALIVAYLLGEFIYLIITLFM